jgi:hypothetical protein
MKYVIVAAVILVSGFLGAQQPSGGAACVNSIEVDGKQYTGRVVLRGSYDAEYPMIRPHATHLDGGETLIDFYVLPPVPKSQEVK